MKETIVTSLVVPVITSKDSSKKVRKVIRWHDGRSIEVLGPKPKRRPRPIKIKTKRGKQVTGSLKCDECGRIRSQLRRFKSNRPREVNICIGCIGKVRARSFPRIFRPIFYPGGLPDTNPRRH